MGYREDLEAAMAHVAALESELARAQRGSMEQELTRLSSERDGAREQVAKLEKELAEATRKVEAAETERRKQIRDQLKKDSREQPRSIKAMKSLFDHNRSCPPLTGPGAGVLCPPCLGAGERVELIRGKTTLGMSSERAQSVFCPRCGHQGWMREGTKR